MKDNKTAKGFSEDTILEEKRTLLKCNNCNTILVEIIEVLNVPESFKIKAYCSCGDSSFCVNTKGKPYCNVVKGSNIEDIIYDNETGDIKVICKKLKS